MGLTMLLLSLMASAAEPPICLHYGPVTLVGTVKVTLASESTNGASVAPRGVFLVELSEPRCVTSEGATSKHDVAIDRLTTVRLDALTPGIEDRLRHRVGSIVRCKGELAGDWRERPQTSTTLSVRRCKDDRAEPLSDRAERAMRDSVLRDARAALRKSSWVTLISLDLHFEYEHFSVSRESCDKGSFCFYEKPVLGSYHAQTKTDLEVIKRVFDSWLAAPEPEALPMCYAPRHGIRFETDGHVYDAELCFECGYGYLYKDFDEEPIATIYADEPSNAWNDLLTDKGVPLSKAARRGDRSPSTAKP